MRLIIWIYGYLCRCTALLQPPRLLAATFEDTAASAVCDSSSMYVLSRGVICITNGNIMRQTEEKAAIAAQRRFLQDFAVELGTISITF